MNQANAHANEMETALPDVLFSEPKWIQLIWQLVSQWFYIYFIVSLLVHFTQNGLFDDTSEASKQVWKGS